MGVAVGLAHWWPVLGFRPAGAFRALGALLLALGLALDLAGIVTFARRRTAIYPNRPAALVVEHGVYAYSRNPMYVGMGLAYTGGALWLGNGWALLLLPVVLLVLRTQVIAREEQHLLARHPEAYAAYCARVRRWL